MRSNMWQTYLAPLQVSDRGPWAGLGRRLLVLFGLRRAGPAGPFGFWVACLLPYGRFICSRKLARVRWSLSSEKTRFLKPTRLNVCQAIHTPFVAGASEGFMGVS